MESDAALSLGGIGLRLGAVLVLVLLNGFFVAAEFALVAARRSKIDQMVAEGDARARTVQHAQEHLDRYISGTQLGITLASLALGWIGEPALASLIDRGLAAVGVGAAHGPGTSAAAHSAAAIGVAFGVITFLHIVLGELAPKSMALSQPEGVSRWVASPLIWFSRLMKPFVYVLNGTANALLRPFGIRPVGEGEHVHSPEELRLLVMQARAHGTLDESDSAMLAGVFDFHEKKAYDVMRPRTEVVALDVDATEDEVWAALRSERYSRYPVYRDTLDDVIGVFLAKDLWLRADDAPPFRLGDYLREPAYVPATKAAERVLDDLRRTRAHLAVVLDEYGGTAGIVTMEDLIEEVIGDINDEYDQREREAFEFDGVLELAGSMSLVDARSDYHLQIPDGDWTTLGGFTFSAIGRLPRVGDRASFPGGELEVVAMEGRRVAAVRAQQAAAAAAAERGAAT
ncbi:hemolysin family protein [Roseisolibacter sp. H3M3-2]|uniref:hemolysin family protein n=1 Tax=Roseisolibacter sp. H3M3-2 TaxID=3031323 RepID=UPI0023DB53C8|nr:hemolysin family protein [Roseisolibacter sp. H3M3-2]MDF1503698.1 hemolysin family protein [Roseisolibacter sp. H3M3-2]